MSDEVTGSDVDMPRLFQAADATSLTAQQAYVNGTRLRLVLVVLAAACGVHAWRVGAGKIDVAGCIAVVLFLGALLVEVWLWRGRLDDTWYDGRAIAESVKTVAWKYAVGADPFPTSLMPNEAKRQLLDKLDGIRDRYRQLELEVVEAPVISEWMDDCRQRPFAERRRVYMTERIVDQIAWYGAKQRYNRIRASQWRTTLVVLEGVGAALALLGALLQVSVTLEPTVAAIAGAIVAWIETKQHDKLARAYSAAVEDLHRARAKLDLAENETIWAIEVNDAEDAISREHTLWLASRSQL